MQEIQRHQGRGNSGEISQGRRARAGRQLLQKWKGVHGSGNGRLRL